MAKDCLQLEGDIHILNENIQQLNSAFRSMTSRLDSFVDQITQIKIFHHQHTDDIYKKMEKKIEYYSKDLSKYDSVFQIEENIKEKVEKSFDEKIKELKKFKNDFILDLITRFDNLESYIKNDRFHSILIEINKLEDEYNKKAVNIVNKLAVKKVNKIKGEIKNVSSRERKK